MLEPSVYDWIKDVVVPSFIGVGSLLVALAAWRTSRQSVRIAQESEVARTRELNRAIDRDDRLRIREEALDEARLLVAWADEERARPAFWFTTRRIDDPPPPETTLQSLRREVKSRLSVSHVPGAELIYAMTEHDFRDESKLRLEDHVMATQYADMWHRRTIARIQRWGIDPRAETPKLEAELRLAESDPAAYSRVSLGQGWENAYDEMSGDSSS